MITENKKYNYSTFYIFVPPLFVKLVLVLVVVLIYNRISLSFPYGFICIGTYY